MSRAGLAGYAAAGCDAQDASFSSRNHVSRGGLRAKEDPFEIDAHDPVPFLFRHVDDRYAIHHTGAAKRVIDLTILCDRAAHHLGDAMWIPDVDFHSDGIALVVANFRGDFFRGVN